ncbi:DUF3800 domain-containing protein [Mesobacillus subterraneus]|uniref:DUF3800 domain-containing protein n=1 Tax=Mesobacillus subterraneus TaxID=285983 RepID=A0A3R9FBN3_9BACI|nr:DUF3800 domain-containing protein [Mesobacillus subterraneus]RSD21064.1 DUF3800 domain-containing protein [Mesobacillus subterraneus]
MQNNTPSGDEQQRKKLERELKRRVLANKLINEIEQEKNNTILNKVGLILNKYPHTRNSDVSLMLKFWEVFEGHKSDSIEKKDMYFFERLTSVARARAKIQNEYGLFPADEKVRKFRRSKEEKEKEFQIESKPEMPIIYIYADETGKNDDFVVVGSLWILDEKRNGQIVRSLETWVKGKKTAGVQVPGEFHFVDIKNNGNNIDIYKEFFSYFMSIASDVISFTAIAVNKKNIKKHIDDLISDLFYQIVRIGIEHEKKNNRISFPKQLSYLKDEEKGESPYRIKGIQDTIVDKLKIHYGDNIKLNKFVPVDSKHVKLIQIADLFTGSLNRIINHQRKNPEAQKNAKDDFAQIVLDSMGLEEIHVDIEKLEMDNLHEEITSDMSKLFVFNE